ncbi:CHAT domain-containing protein [Streptomyces sp. NPDC088789]|uniref:CHAT domain-containing protein n=1 Tax=Streptomyces sp. NPDC088789 TaxID=3365899 RepID=UPI003805348D
MRETVRGQAWGGQGADDRWDRGSGRGRGGQGQGQGEGEQGHGIEYAYAPGDLDAHDRNRYLAAIRARLRRAVTPGGGVDAAVVLGGAADAELRGLLRAVDPRTDPEARHTAGWLCAARASADPGRSALHGSMAGILLFPVWAADPGDAELVPPELAAAWAATDAALRPDPADADGPAEWAAQCVAHLLVLEGRQHTPPPDASAHDRKLHEMAAWMAYALPLPRENRLLTAIGAGSLAVLATPEYHPAYPDRRDDLARALALKGGPWPFGELLGGDPVRLAYRALKSLPPGSPERLRALAALGARLEERYARSYDPEDLDEAAGLAREVLAQLPPGDPRLPESLGALGSALILLRHRDGATPEQCDEVVDICRRARPGHPEGPAPTGHRLALALLLRSQHTGRVTDLDEAVAVLTETLTEARTPTETTILRNLLGNALRARAAMTGAKEDLDAAAATIALAPDAPGSPSLPGHPSLQGHPTLPGHPGPTNTSAPSNPSNPSNPHDPQSPHDPQNPPEAALLSRALILHARYKRDPVAHAGDLDEASRLLRQVGAVTPLGSPDRPSVLHHLGVVLTAGHERSGDAEVLNEAVRVLREAVALTPERHEVLGLRLLNLSVALSLRYQRTEDAADLREARECRQRAAALPAMGRAHHAAVVGSAGLSLLTGIDRATDRAAQLDECVRLLREALALTPDGDPQLPKRRHNLAAALLTQADTTRHVGPVREAQELADAVVAVLPAHSPDLPRALTLAADARTHGARMLPSRTARDEAFALLRRAVTVTPAGHPLRAQRTSNLAAMLRHRGPARHGDRTALTEVADLYREAAREERCPPLARLDAARDWGDVRAGLGDWEGALDGYVTAVDLLPAVAPRHLVRDDQEFLLGRTVGLGAAAAACAVRQGRPGLAVGLLEQARGVLLSHAFDADSDLTRLRERAPALAARFEELREALDTATSGQEFTEGGEGADRRQRLAAEWRELIARVRAEHPGLGLLRPVREWDEREVRATAAEGPVILVNVAPYGSDALVVTDRSVDAVPLPGLDPATAARRRRAFQDALLRIQDPRTTRKAAHRAQREVRDTLGWLWETVTGPVLARLPGAGRVWWSPAGLLGTLPLHAAAPADGGPGALDRVVSSYTPTLRTLHHARRRAARPADTAGGTLVVSVPDAAGQTPLPGAGHEAARLAERLPGAVLLKDADATHTTVVAALHRHAYAHFACHAFGDLDRPSGSRLVLHDHTHHPLTVRDLARLRLPSVRLAYLSACDTLRTSPELADEAVHIVSAFQMAGFPHVIGSLWHVDDVIGAQVALQVYETLHRGDGTLAVTRTAEALHHAVRTLRDTYPHTPSLWACQVHAGP